MRLCTRGERRITVHHRGDDGAWRVRTAITDGKVEVASVGAALIVDEIYRRSEIR